MDDRARPCDARVVWLRRGRQTIATPKWINQVTMEAWKQGIKTLYYTRTESVLRGDIATRAVDPDCVACDG